MTIDLTDLRELVSLIEFRLSRTRQAYEPNAVAVAMKDPTWPFDWRDLQARYADAKSKCVGLDPSTALPDITPADANYEAVARAVQQNANQRSKGDLADLMARLALVGFPVDEKGTPQPKRTFTDKFLEYTNAVPTPGGLLRGYEIAALVFLAWKAGLFDKVLGIRQIRVRQR